jgi:hypothetical protein
MVPPRITTASPSTISPLASARPRTAPLGPRTKSTTVPCRSTAPRSSAARIKPVVNARGSTTAAVDRAEPSRPLMTLPAPRSLAPSARGIVLGGVTAVGRHPPISPRIAELGGKLGMELETSPRQSIERAAASPIERQKSRPTTAPAPPQITVRLREPISLLCQAHARSSGRRPLGAKGHMGVIVGQCVAARLVRQLTSDLKASFDSVRVICR